MRQMRAITLSILSIMRSKNKDVYMVALREEGRLIGYYEKHEYRNAETMKQYDLW